MRTWRVRRSLSVVAAASALVFLGLSARGASNEDEGFLIPGVDFSKLDLKTGAWCRYRVADEAMGLVDSSEIYVGVPGSQMTERGKAFWVEIETHPTGTGAQDSQVLKMLVLERITSFEVGDSLSQYVVALYSRNGTNPAEAEDPKSFKRFSLVIPTTDSTWVATPDVPATTAAGEFTCVEKERVVVDDKEVPTGNIILVKKARDDFKVWFCDDIPVFRLARCVIVRDRETETIPKIKGIPPSGKRTSTTTAELVGFGWDAKPILTVGAAKNR